MEDIVFFSLDRKREDVGFSNKNRMPTVDLNEGIVVVV
jgi:hypothetical protein